MDVLADANLVPPESAVAELTKSADLWETKKS
jgi:hypothetical protein